jgi:hypothetical protein
MTHESLAQYEDGFASLERFADQEFGTVDGAHASQLVVAGSRSVIEQTLHESSFSQDYYALSFGTTPESFRTQTARLAGMIVLAPYMRNNRVLAHPETRRPILVPSVISPEAHTSPGIMKLSSVREPYNGRGISRETWLQLSAAAQVETPGIGRERTDNIGAEAEHFLTIMSAAIDPATELLWRRSQTPGGSHPNHSWRETGNVVGAVGQRGLYQKPLTTHIFRGSLPRSVQLLWHVGLQNEAGQALAADQPEALRLMQGLGYLTLMDNHRLDTVKRLLK